MGFWIPAFAGMTGRGAGSRVGAREAVGAQTGENEMPDDRGCSELCPCWGQPFERPRVCPLCGHIFKGNGWDGIDPHYKSKHETRHGD